MNIFRKIKSLNKIKRLFNDRFLYPNIPAVGPGSVVFLSGAYILGNLERMSKRVGPKGHVFGVEANPIAYKAIEHECAKISNLTYINSAVWDSKGIMQFISSKDDYHSYDKLVHPDIPFKFPHNLKDSTIIDVPTNTIDSILQDRNCDKLDYLELMVNGAEIAALKGALKTIKNSPNIRIRINCVHPRPLDELLQFLNEYEMSYTLTYTDKNDLSNKDLTLARILATNS